MNTKCLLDLKTTNNNIISNYTSKIIKEIVNNNNSYDIHNKKENYILDYKNIENNNKHIKNNIIKDRKPSWKKYNLLLGINNNYNSYTKNIFNKSFFKKNINKTMTKANFNEIEYSNSNIIFKNNESSSSGKIQNSIYKKNCFTSRIKSPINFKKNVNLNNINTVKDMLYYLKTSKEINKINRNKSAKKQLLFMPKVPKKSDKKLN